MQWKVAEDIPVEVVVAGKEAFHTAVVQACWVFPTAAAAVEIVPAEVDNNFDVEVVAPEQDVHGVVEDEHGPEAVLHVAAAVVEEVDAGTHAYLLPFPWMDHYPIVEEVDAGTHAYLLPFP